MLTADEVRHWPVLAWIRLRVPPAPPPMQLTAGPPPPPSPPLDILEREPVATDPTVRICTYFEPLGDGAMRLVWQADQPESLLAEFRGPALRGRVPSEEVRRFWAAVKSKVAELGGLPIEAADPYP